MTRFRDGGQVRSLGVALDKVICSVDLDLSPERGMKRMQGGYP